MQPKYNGINFTFSIFKQRISEFVGSYKFIFKIVSYRCICSFEQT